MTKDWNNEYFIQKGGTWIKLHPGLTKDNKTLPRNRRDTNLTIRKVKTRNGQNFPPSCWHKEATKGNIGWEIFPRQEAPLLSILTKAWEPETSSEKTLNKMLAKTDWPKEVLEGNQSKNPQEKLTAINKRDLRKTNKLSEATKKSNKRN